LPSIRGEPVTHNYIKIGILKNKVEAARGLSGNHAMVSTPWLHRVRDGTPANGTWKFAARKQEGTVGRENNEEHVEDGLGIQA
jgi:hypothetical protein